MTLPTREPDILIIGAGPAGLSAAIELKKIGVDSVVCVDREVEAGGIPRHCFHPGFGLLDKKFPMSGPRYAKKLKSEALQNGVSLLEGTTVFPGEHTQRRDLGTYRLVSSRGIEELKPRRLLIATGCRERPRAARLIPGKRLDGIFTTSSLQQWTHLHHNRVLGPAVIVGAEHVSYSAALTLRSAGARPLTFVTEHPATQSFSVFDQGVRFVTGARLCSRHRVIDVEGKQTLEAVVLENLDSQERTRVPCSTLVFTGEFTPDQEFARTLGVPIHPDSRGPWSTFEGQTLIPGIFSAGNVNHAALNADHCAIEGRRTASAIVGGTPSFLYRLHSAAPIDWVFPNLIAPESIPDHPTFWFRVRNFSQESTLVLRQGNRTLYTWKYRSLWPNHWFKFDSRWLERMKSEAGEPFLTLE